MLRLASADTAHRLLPPAEPMRAEAVVDHSVPVPYLSWRLNGIHRRNDQNLSHPSVPSRVQWDDCCALGGFEDYITLVRKWFLNCKKGREMLMGGLTLKQLLGAHVEKNHSL